jgi:hypothetical protein
MTVSAWPRVGEISTKLGKLHSERTGGNWTAWLPPMLPDDTVRNRVTVAPPDGRRWRSEPRRRGDTWLPFVLRTVSDRLEQPDKGGSVEVPGPTERSGVVMLVGDVWVSPELDQPLRQL